MIEKPRLLKLTNWLGSTTSIVSHTLAFIGFGLLWFFGIDWNTILLTLTTIVSLEAIYLELFIQYSVNRQAQTVKELTEGIDELQEDVEGITEDDQTDTDRIKKMEKALAFLIQEAKSKK